MMMKLPLPFPPPDPDSADPDAPIFLDDPSFRLSRDEMRRAQFSAELTERLRPVIDALAARQHEAIAQSAAALQESGTLSGNAEMETETETESKN